jgi:hypothetical protein
MRVHHYRQLDLASGRRGAFGDKLRVNPARVSERGREEQR